MIHVRKTAKQIRKSIHKPYPTRKGFLKGIHENEVLGLAKMHQCPRYRNNCRPESCDFYRGPRNPTTVVTYKMGNGTPSLVVEELLNLSISMGFMPGFRRAVRRTEMALPGVAPRC
jgi:hypothetical protein